MIVTSTFHARHSGVLRKITDAVNDLSQNVVLVFDDTGISMKTMDHSNVCIIMFKLYSHGFKEYVCQKDVHEVGIYLPSLSKILKCIDKDDEITLSSDTDDELIIKAFSQERKRMATYNLKLMDVDSCEIELGDLEHAAKLTFDSSDYTKTIRDMSTLGDDITISATGSGVTLSTSGEMGVASIALEIDDNIVVTNDVGIRVALRYMNSFSKASSLGKCVDVYLIPEMPLIVQIDMPDDIGYMKFYLAPKMDDDDDGDDINDGGE